MTLLVTMLAALWALWMADGQRTLRQYLWCICFATVLNVAVLRYLGNVSHLASYTLTAIVLLAAALRVAEEVSKDMPRQVYHLVLAGSTLWSILAGMWMLPDLMEGWGYLQLQFGIVLIEAMLLSVAGMVLVASSVYTGHQWRRSLGMTWIWLAIGKYIYLQGAAQAPSGHWVMISAWMATATISLGCIKTGFDLSLERRIRMLASNA